MRRIMFSVVVAVLVAAGCSSGGSSPKGDSSSNSTNSSGPATTAVAKASAVAPYAGKGPHTAGVAHLKLDDGRQVVVWYPARPGATSGKQETIEVSKYLTPALQAKVPADKQVPYPVDAYEGAAPDTTGAPYPVVLFSHGFAGYPEQSTNLTTHLAQWGFVVVAPEHVERSLGGLLGDHAVGVPKSTDVAVLGRSLDLVEKDNTAESSPLKGLVDASKVAVTGHSAGAGAAYQMASADPRIKAFISYSVGFGGADGGAAPAAPKQPGMLMLGTKDGIIPPDSTRNLFQAMNKPKYLVEIPGAGHLVFSDICEVGKSQGGIVAIAKELKLGIPDSLLKLGSDGCEPDHLDPTKAFGAIDQLSVAFLRYELGIDKSPKGLDTKAVAGLGAPVSVTAEP